MESDMFEMNKDGVINLLNNHIPLVVISLEQLYDQHERFLRQKMIDKKFHKEETMQVNIGTLDNPKHVLLGKECTKVDQKKFTTLFKDIFAWSYDYKTPQ